MASNRQLTGRLAVMLLLGLTPALHAESLALATLNWPPYSGELLDGGALTRVLRQAWNSSVVRYEVLPWRRAMLAGMSGQRGLLGFYPASGEECGNAGGLLSAPIGFYQYGLIQRRLEPYPWTQPQDLQGPRIGVVDGYDNGPLVGDLLRTRRLTVERVSSDTINLRKLEAGRIALAITEVHVFDYLQQHLGLQGLELNPKALTERLPLHVCFNHSPAALVARTQLEQGLQGLDLDALDNQLVTPAGDAR